MRARTRAPLPSREQVAMLRMPLDEGGHERATRNHAVAVLARVAQRMLGQLRSNAAAAQGRWHERVIEIEHPARELVVTDEAGSTAEIEDEPLGIGLVADTGRCRAHYGAPCALQ